jgi:hypothetical protein
MAEIIHLDKENERNLALLNNSLQNAFGLANATLNLIGDVRRMKQSGDDHAAILRALTGLLALEDLALAVRDDRKR